VQTYTPKLQPDSLEWFDAGTYMAHYHPG